jgi:fibronectin type 3 domain-containing protein
MRRGRNLSTIRRVGTFATIAATIGAVVVFALALAASAQQVPPSTFTGPAVNPATTRPHVGPPGPNGFNRPESQVCGGPGPDHARCLVHVLDHSDGVTPDVGASPTGLSPSSIQSIYGFPTATTAGAGETIAIVDAYDDPTVFTDLDNFDAQYGLTCNGCINKVVEVDSLGNPPSADSGWALEISLDVEWAHAIAPAAHIMLVESLDSSYANLLAGEDYASAHAQYVSNSWGGGEFCLAFFYCETSYDSHFTTPGVSYFAASGDSGLPATYPSSSPNVISVGGTTLHFDGTGTFTSETGWASGGGGCSADETANPAQSAFGQYGQVSCGGQRATPDVALDADPNSGVAVYDSTAYNGQSGWFTVGGTSVSTPIWAARSADQGKVVNASYVYGNNINFRDITSGNNGAPCLSGYDLCSGRGSWLDLAPTAPTAPQNLSATPGNNTVGLSWQAPLNNGGSTVTQYSIYRSTTANSEGPLGAPIATVSGLTTSYPDNTAVNGTTYYYKVTATNATGEGALSNEASATPTNTIAPPGSPTSLKATATTTSISLSWTAPTGPVSSYNVYRGTAPGGEGALPYQTGVSGSPWTDPSTASGTTYYYKVTAVNGGGEGPASNETSADLNPIAAFTYSCTNATCNFDGSTSQDAVTYAWAGGNSFTASGVTPSHTYNATGTFTVTLKITDTDSSETASTSKSIKCSRTSRRAPITCH